MVRDSCIDSDALEFTLHPDIADFAMCGLLLSTLMFLFLPNACLHFSPWHRCRVIHGFGGLPVTVVGVHTEYIVPVLQGTYCDFVADVFPLTLQI